MTFKSVLRSPMFFIKWLCISTIICKLVVKYMVSVLYLVVALENCLAVLRIPSLGADWLAFL